MFILSGSRAADFHGLKLRGNIEKSDFDVIGLSKDYEIFKSLITKNQTYKEGGSPKSMGKRNIRLANGTTYEYDGTDCPSNLILLEMMFDGMDQSKIKETMLFTIPLHILYLIKRSHVNYPIWFDKTIFDLIKLQKYKKEILSEEEKKYFELLRIETHARYGRMRMTVEYQPRGNPYSSRTARMPELDREAMDRLFALAGDPKGVKLRFDAGQGQFDPELFMELGHEAQLDLIREEVIVVGMTGFYIPSNGTMPQQHVYLNGLKKFIMNMSKGWLQDFVLDNIAQLIDPKINFIDRYRREVATLGEPFQDPGRA